MSQTGPPTYIVKHNENVSEFDAPLFIFGCRAFRTNMPRQGDGLEEIPDFVKDLMHLKEFGFACDMNVRRFLSGRLEELK